MTKKAATSVTHVHWHDALVLTGAGLLVVVSLHDRRWLLLALGLGMIVAMGMRVLVTVTLARRSRRRGREGPEGS